MAMNYDGKTYRNLQEQVGYLTQYLTANALANEMGIKVLGRVDTAADLPENDPDHPFEYGDAYMVGVEGQTPYRMVIWSRDAGDGNPGWFDIGYFPTAPDEFSIVEVGGSPVHVFNADTKLDKNTSVTTYTRIYAKAPDGSQSMYSADSAAQAGFLVVRTTNGQIRLPDQGTYTPSDNQAIGKGYADSNYLAKQTGTTTRSQAYLKDADGTQSMKEATASVVGDALVVRANTGQIWVSPTPTHAEHAASKGYVDTSTTGKRYLHQLQLTFTISAGIYLSIIGRIINSSNSSITSIGYQEMMDLIVDYGAYEPGGTPQPASVTKCPESFHQDNLDEPNFGFLAYYKSGGNFNQLYVDSTNGINVTDVVTVW